MKERPISIVTGQPSKRGKRLKSLDGMTWKQRNRVAVNSRNRALYAKNPEKYLEYQKRYRSGTARPKVLEYNRAWCSSYRAYLRLEMIREYGMKCNCCGETETAFLQLDHVNNDGHLDRKQHKTSAKLFAKLKALGWPKDRYQLLCANCNFGKLMNGGICPHLKQEVCNVS